MNWKATIGQVGRLLLSQEGLCSSFHWQGHDCHGVRTSLHREDVATDAGLAGEYKHSLLCPASEFDGLDLPKPRLDKLVVDGKTMRVLAVETDSVKATVRIHLGDVLE